MTDTLKQQLVDQVKQSSELGRALRIEGSGSKAFYGRPVSGQALPMTGYQGIVKYDPTELVVQVRAGTAISELEMVLAEKGQRLAFEPPMFKGGSGTVGGMVASGLAGPRRPWSGDVRDYVLGASIINGRGDYLQFGGQVMKNVAGYDVSRLMAGSMGSLGVLMELSLKVLPAPKMERFFILAVTLDELLQRATTWAKNMSPVSGVSHDGSRGYVRLEGSARVLEQFAKNEALVEDLDGGQYWIDLRNHGGAFFESDAPLWRLSLPKWTVLKDLKSPFLMDWAGAQYWVKGSERSELQALANHTQGYLYAYHQAESSTPFPPLSKASFALHKRLKLAYDPEGILNPGRMYNGV